MNSKQSSPDIITNITKGDKARSFPIQNKTCVLLTNYGDDSLALIQWTLESKLFDFNAESKLKVVYIDTGFASESWVSRVAQGKLFVESAGLDCVHLHSKISFQEAVLGRGEFPSPKFQWCSTLLKGLPLLDWLDEVDLNCSFVILSAKRRNTLLAPHDNLPEWQEKVEHFNGRSVWHPILEYTEAPRDELLKRAGFEPLYHRSLECEPCINSCAKTLANLSEKDMNKIRILEETLDAPLFAKEDFEGAIGIEAVVANAKIDSAKIDNAKIDNAKKNEGEKIKTKLKNGGSLSQYLTLFYRGCGNPFGCGL